MIPETYMEWPAQNKGEDPADARREGAALTTREEAQHACYGVVSPSPSYGSLLHFLEPTFKGLWQRMGEFLWNNSNIKGIGNMNACRPDDQYPHERGT
jgi:hypothetical protein